MMSSCIDKPDHFTTTGGVEYKLLDFLESEDIPEIGNYLSLYTTYMTLSDSIFYSSTSFKFNKMEFHHLQKAEEGTYGEVLAELQLGDSAVITIDTENFFTNYLEAKVPEFLTDEAEINIHVRLIKAQAQEDYETDRANEKDLMELKELATISDYLKASDLNFVEINGLHIAIIESTMDSTEQLSFGNMMELHYSGVFVENGNVFYSTERNGVPDEFSYGRQGQLIPGLELALSAKLYNDSLEVLIPSSLAFGDKGSVGGIVPPYTALKYNVRIRKVNQVEVN